MKIRSLFAVSLLAIITACGGGLDPELEAATEGREANLSFHVVNDASNNRGTMEVAIERGVSPPGTLILPYPEYNTHLIVDERTRIDQDCIRSAKEGLHPESNSPIMNFKFTDECAKLFGKMTAENMGRRFAVVMDGEIITAPNIRSEIWGGSGFIEGGFANMQEARELAYILNRHQYRLRQQAKEEEAQ